MIELINTGHKTLKSRNVPTPLIQWKLVKCPDRDARQLQSMSRFIYEAHDFFERLASEGDLRFSDQHVIQMCRNTKAVELPDPWRECTPEQVKQMRNWLARYIRAFSDGEQTPDLYLTGTAEKPHVITERGIEPAPEGDDIEPEEEIVQVAIEDMSYTELQAALKERGLDAVGKSDVLRERLTQAVIAEQV
jgi:hypothetical protein